MKRIYLIISILFVAITLSQAQNADQRTPRVSRGADRNRQNQPTGGQTQSDLSVRAQTLNEQLTQEMGNARWMRVIYRELDLMNEKNAPLYYPVQETNGMVNLFTSVFQLLSEGKIHVYKYLADYESFDDDNLLSFKDMLDNFSIYYEVVPAGGGRPERYVINSSDIPSQEVKSYYVKEVWYFDQNNSVYDIKTLAVCPIAFMTSDIGQQRMPMFWVKYEDISPYVKKNYIMVSSINNAKTLTVDDYFRRRMFDGEIVKTENLLGLALQQYCPTEDSVRAEQRRIEAQLKSFNDSLWIKPDTITVVSKKEKKKVTTRSSKKDSGVTTDKKTTQEKAPKQQPAKPEKATKSSPSRSIRRN